MKYWGNAFAVQWYLNNYLALAVGIYQAIVTALYLLIHLHVRQLPTVQRTSRLNIKKYIIIDSAVALIALIIVKYITVANNPVKANNQL